MNNKCYCGSDKKYKKCCFLEDERKRQEENTYVESESMVESLAILRENFPQYNFKNVSNKLTNNSYKLMQIQHMKDNVCLVAEKYKPNERVFNDRDRNKDDYDLLLMYHGAYRIMHGGFNVKLYIISLKSFFANPSIENYAPSSEN